MHFFHNINNEKKIANINNFMQKPTNKLFLLIYMEGCNPCKETRPEWNKIYTEFHEINDDTAIADIEQSHISKLKFIKFELNGFPTMKFITNKGNTHQNFEDSNIRIKNRDITSFIDWIKSKTHSKKNKTKTHRGGKSKRHKNKKNKTKKNTSRRRR